MFFQPGDPVNTGFCEVLKMFGGSLREMLGEVFGRCSGGCWVDVESLSGIFREFVSMLKSLCETYKKTKPCENLYKQKENSGVQLAHL